MNTTWTSLGVYLYVGIVSVVYCFARLRHEPYRVPGYVLHPSVGAILFAVLLWPVAELVSMVSNWPRMTWRMRAEVSGSALLLVAFAVACVWGLNHTSGTVLIKLAQSVAILAAYGVTVWWLESLRRSRSLRWGRS